MSEKKPMTNDEVDAILAALGVMPTSFMMAGFSPFTACELFGAYVVGNKEADKQIRVAIERRERENQLIEARLALQRLVLKNLKMILLGEKTNFQGGDTVGRKHRKHKEAKRA